MGQGLGADHKGHKHKRKKNVILNFIEIKIIFYEIKKWIDKPQAWKTFTTEYIWQDTDIYNI